MLVKSLLLMFVNLQHEVYDEEEYDTVMATIRDVVGQGKKKGAKRIMIEGDLKIELGLGEGATGIGCW